MAIGICEVCRQTMPSKNTNCCSMACKRLRTQHRVVERFLGKILISDECWKWLGSKNNRGYGKFGLHPHKMIYAHRFSYELFIGAIPGPYDRRIQNNLICHHCDNPPCVRPSHLFLGTQSDNLSEVFIKGRRPVQIPPSGEANPFAKITAVQAEEIRRRYNEFDAPIKILASEYGIGTSTIWRIINNQSYSNPEYRRRRRERNRWGSYLLDIT